MVINCFYFFLSFIEMKQLLSHTYSKHYTIGIISKILFCCWTNLSKLIDFLALK